MRLFRIGRKGRNIQVLPNLPQLPPLGEATKVYPVRLTEPEINAIHACAAFIESACADLVYLKPYWNHYGPTLKGLSERLAEFDD